MNSERIARDIKRRIDGASTRWPHIEKYGLFRIGNTWKVVGYGTERWYAACSKVEPAGCYTRKVTVEQIKSAMEDTQ